MPVVTKTWCEIHKAVMVLLKVSRLPIVLDPGAHDGFAPDADGFSSPGGCDGGFRDHSGHSGGFRYHGGGLGALQLRWRLLVDVQPDVAPETNPRCQPGAGIGVGGR